MADNVDITPGAGATVAADDILGVKFQRVKMTWGADGVAGDVAAGNELPVSVVNTSFAATQATASSLNAQVVGNIASGATDSGNPVKVAGAVAATGGDLPSLANGQRGSLHVGARGALYTQLVFGQSAGQVASGGVGTPSDGATNNNVSGVNTFAYGVVYNGSTWDRVQKPNSTSRILSSAATTNATVAKNAVGNLHTINGRNNAVTALYLKIYNKATAPTVGTDTPILTLYLPATSSFSFSWPNGGRYFSAGISYALTVNAADADTTAVAAGDITALNLDVG